MGVSLQDINAGVLETSKVLAETMSLWNQVTGKTKVPASTTQAPVTAAPAGGSSGAQTAGASATKAAMPQWVWLAAAGVGLFLVLPRLKG
jgi:hypothetical protein